MIRRRRVWAAITATLVALGAVTAVAVSSAWLFQTAGQDGFARADLAADAAMQQGLHTVSVIDGLLEQIELCHRLRLDGQDDAAATVEQQLRDAIRASGIGVTDVVLGDATGAVTWSALGQPGARSIAGEPYFSALRDGAPGLQSSDVITDPVAGRAELRFVRPVPDATGTSAGFAMVTLDAAALSTHLSALHFDIAAVPLLVRLQDGAVIAHAGPPTPASDPRPMLDRGLLVVMRAAAAGQARVASALTGRDSFAGFRALGTGDLAVVVELDAAAQLAPAQSHARMIQAAAALLVLLCAVVLAGQMQLLHRREARETLAAARLRIATAEATRAELEALLAGLPVAVYQGRVAADGDFTRRYLSDNIEAITGWPAAELMLPGDWEAHLDGGGSGSVAAFFHRVLHHGSGTIEYKLRRPEGGVTWLSERARIAVRLPDGGAEVVGTVADVTTERELAVQAEMSAKLSMLGEMASGMAHELMQPVTAISLSAERADLALQRDPIDQKAIARTLKIITTQSLRAGEIIDQLRRFGRADQGPPGPVRLEAAIRGALALAAGPLRDASIAPEFDVVGNLPPVLGRLVPVEQVLLNLLMNARDALLTRPAAARRLAIVAVAEGDWVRVRITDSGGGLPASVLARLFEPFVTTKPAGQGTGLGLSICLRLMRGFGGDIAARNTDAGAEFSLTFRAMPERAEAAVSRDRRE
jgi:C4-dicarboxylate-specific signal transduction histidine kinase